MTGRPGRGAERVLPVTFGGKDPFSEASPGSRTAPTGRSGAEPRADPARFGAVPCPEPVAASARPLG
ncbi:hypothetical protein EF879_16870 [Micromonospora sp. HM5-17]|nr:hypothetical protein EF879_16870 [Micromonospora sp. HM5-17]